METKQSSFRSYGLLKTSMKFHKKKTNKTMKLYKHYLYMSRVMKFRLTNKMKNEKCLSVVRTELKTTKFVP